MYSSLCHLILWNKMNDESIKNLTNVKPFLDKSLNIDKALFASIFAGHASRLLSIKGNFPLLDPQNQNVLFLENIDELKHQFSIYHEGAPVGILSMNEELLSILVEAATGGDPESNLLKIKKRENVSKSDLTILENLSNIFLLSIRESCKKLMGFKDFTWGSYFPKGDLTNPLAKNTSGFFFEFETVQNGQLHLFLDISFFKGKIRTL